jgi:hypothetical protein
MATRKRIATVAASLSALAFAVPVAGASAAPISVYAGGQVATQNGIGAALQAGTDAWKGGVSAGVDGWNTGEKAAQGGLSAGITADRAAIGVGAQALGIPLYLGAGLPLGISIG